MGRRAVAATLVSVIFFSTLLLANAAVYAAGGSYLSATVLASAQHRETEYAPVLASLSSFASLLAAEDYLSVNPMGCSSEAAYLGSMGGTSSMSGDDQGLLYNASTAWAYAADDQVADNLTALKPFDGYSSGALNILVTTRLDESMLTGLPSYEGQVQQIVHLPIALESLTSLCLSTLSLMHQDLSSLASCNSSSVEDALSSLNASYPYLDSVNMGGSAQMSDVTCYIEYWVTIAQSYEGVSGISSWSLYGEQAFSNQTSST